MPCRAWGPSLQGRRSACPRQMTSRPSWPTPSHPPPQAWMDVRLTGWMWTLATASKLRSCWRWWVGPCWAVFFPHPHRSLFTRRDWVCGVGVGGAGEHSASALRRACHSTAATRAPPASPPPHRALVHSYHGMPRRISQTTPVRARCWNWDTPGSDAGCLAELASFPPRQDVPGTPAPATDAAEREAIDREDSLGALRRRWV